MSVVQKLNTEELMFQHPYPKIGTWYQDYNYNELFKVVAKDELDGYIEIQYFSGEIEEIDFETWFELDLKRVPAPEDWTGPYEITKDDRFPTDETIHPEDWSGVLNE